MSGKDIERECRRAEESEEEIIDEQLEILKQCPELSRLLYFNMIIENARHLCAFEGLEKALDYLIREATKLKEKS